jgi:predicted RNA binding protein YcfA (HicA-like mRNA interferase family)
MTTSKPLNQKRARKLLEAHGWTKTVGGKHNVKMEKPGRRPITLPKHGGADYGKGLLAAILREAGIESAP